MAEDRTPVVRTDDHGEPVGRAFPPPSGGEVETLRAFLAAQRDTLRWKTGGLTKAELLRPLHPTAMTLGGLLTHLAFVEDGWVRRVLLGQDRIEPWATVRSDPDPDAAWHLAERLTASEIRETFDTTVRWCEHAVDTLLADGGLDRLSVLDPWGDGTRVSVRWVLGHLIEEYARHVGHADLLREAIDGLVGE